MNAEEYLRKNNDNYKSLLDHSEIYSKSTLISFAEAYAEKYHQEKMKEAIKLLSVARCPNGNCDNNGTIAYQTQSGDCELEPCQWCHEKQHLTN